jgi:hypothetical protein
MISMYDRREKFLQDRDKDRSYLELQGDPGTATYDLFAGYRTADEKNTNVDPRMYDFPAGLLYGKNRLSNPSSSPFKLPTYQPYGSQKPWERNTRDPFYISEEDYYNSQLPVVNNGFSSGREQVTPDFNVNNNAGSSNIPSVDNVYNDPYFGYGQISPGGLLTLDDSAYYTYGQTNSKNPGEAQFFTDNGVQSPQAVQMAEGGMAMEPSMEPSDTREVDLPMTRDVGPEKGQQIIQIILAEAEKKGLSGPELEELMADLQEIVEMPGGVELLLEEMTNQAMTGAEQLTGQKFSRGGKAVRLYAEGGQVSPLNSMAQTVREGGRGDDEILLHLSPEEFEGLQSMWGPAEINPVTGLPEYGFLDRAWKKVKSTVKRIVKNPVFQAIAPIVLAIVIPGVGAAIGGAMGFSGTAASIAGNAAIGAGFGAASGNGAKGALAGAIMGGAAGGGGSLLGGAAGLSGQAATIAGNAVAGGLSAGVAGGDWKKGALLAGAATAATPFLQKGIAGAKNAVTGASTSAATGASTGNQVAPTQMVGPPAPTNTMDLSGNLIPQSAGVQTYPVGQAPLSNSLNFGSVNTLQPRIETPFTAPTAVDQAVNSSFLDKVNPTNWTVKGTGDFLQKASLPLALGASALGMGQPEEQGPPDYINPNGAPVYGPEYLTSLPDYQFNRTQQNLGDGYDSYGRNYSEANFFANNNINAGQTSPEAYSAAQQMNSTPTQLISQGYSFNNGQWVMNKALGGYAEGGGLSMLMHQPDPKFIGEVNGPGTGRSDDIPAQLSDGEYVIDAETVALLGDGSTDAGAARLDELRENIRRHKGKKLSRGEFSDDAHSPEKYLSGAALPESELERIRQASPRMRKAKGGNVKDRGGKIRMKKARGGKVAREDQIVESWFGDNT